MNTNPKMIGAHKNVAGGFSIAARIGGLHNGQIGTGPASLRRANILRLNQEIRETQCQKNQAALERPKDGAGFTVEPPAPTSQPPSNGSNCS